MATETQVRRAERAALGRLAWRASVRRPGSAARVLAGSTSAKLFAFFACLYILTYKASLTAIDGIMMYETTQSMVDRGSLAIVRADIGVPGRDGLYYSFYGIGTSLVQIPFYLVGKLLGHLSHAKADNIAVAITELVFPLGSALCVVAIYAMARVLDYPRPTAVRATLALGLLTSLWVYSKVDFSEPLLALGVTAAVLFAFAAARSTATTPTTPARRESRDLMRYTLLTGVALGWAILVKYIALAFVPLFCVYLLWTLPQPRTLLRAAQQQLVLLAPVFVAGLITLLVNDLRFGSPLNTGYPPGGRLFTIPFYEGDWGLLLSTFRGLIWYDPLLFAGLLLLPLLAWRRPREGLLPLGIVLLTLVLYGGFVDWMGGTDYGPRYLLQAMPLLLLPAMALGWFGSVGEREHLLPRAALDWLRSAPRGVIVCRAGQAGLALLIAASFVVTVLGVLVNMYAYDIYGFSDPHVAPLWACPIAFAFWFVPLSLSYSFTRGFPAGYAASNFPFGPPFPHAANMPQALGEFYTQQFWWTLTPRPTLAFAVGGLILGGVLVHYGRQLWRLARAGSEKPTSTS